jgi:tryptophan synthase beta chain
MKTNYPDQLGYYGEFGGACIPELLYEPVEELRQNYLNILDSPEFIAEFKSLLRHYTGRPSPLYRALRLSERYGTQIFLKREDLLHTGSHKINNALGQAILAKKLGKKHIIAETGAGQHGVATASVCALFNLPCKVFMGEEDIHRQAPNVERMRMLGTEVVPVTSGSKTLKDATNEAIRYWISHPADTYYLIGSVVGPHPYPDLVARLQSIISEEMKAQLLEQTGSELPDAIIACVGGGSNAAGAFYHYLNEPSVRLIGVEAAGKGTESGFTAATLHNGRPGVLHGSKTMLLQTSDGQITEPYSISAGLDYPGIGPMHADLFKSGRADYIAVTDRDALEAASELAKLEGIIPALESAHAFAALKKIKFQPEQVVVINLSGRGDKDLQTYIRELSNP